MLKIISLQLKKFHQYALYRVILVKLLYVLNRKTVKMQSESQILMRDRTAIIDLFSQLLNIYARKVLWNNFFYSGLLKKITAENLPQISVTLSCLTTACTFCAETTCREIQWAQWSSTSAPPTETILFFEVDSMSSSPRWLPIFVSRPSFFHFHIPFSILIRG